jgi:molecular chaperone DnaJ
MKLKEAYTILDLPNTATPEEAKKQYKKLTKQFHPDVNKEPDAEAKFKKINEAYQIIQSGAETEPLPDVYAHRPAYDPFSAIFGRGHNKKQYYTSDINLDMTLSFRESVLGCEKELTYSRQIKCPHCQGSGDKPINNGCKSCAGRGQVVTRSGGAVYVRSCPDCHGRTRTVSCTECNSQGVLEAQATMRTTIPAAITENNILRLQGVGHFAGTLMGLQDQYTNVLLHFKITPDGDLRLEGKDVVSDLHISLLDALRGCMRLVHTIDGDKPVDVQGGIKNKEEILLSVAGHNNVKHRLIIHVGYPANTEKLIDVLLEEGK